MHTCPSFENLGDAFCPVCREDLNEPPELASSEQAVINKSESGPVALSMYEIGRACRSLAMRLAREDCTKGMIIKRLEELGADETLAAEITEQAMASTKQHHRSNGALLMILGAVIAAVGLIISIGSIAVVSLGGGTVLVAYGIVAIGFGMLFRGLVKMLSGTNSVE